MDSDDTEGAERPPVDAKNMAGGGTKRRVDHERTLMEIEDARSRKVREEDRVATANTQGETNGAATYVTPPRPAATAPPSPLPRSSPPAGTNYTVHLPIYGVTCRQCASGPHLSLAGHSDRVHLPRYHHWRR